MGGGQTGYVAKVRIFLAVLSGGVPVVGADSISLGGERPPAEVVGNPVRSVPGGLAGGHRVPAPLCRSNHRDVSRVVDAMPEAFAGVEILRVPRGTQLVPRDYLDVTGNDWNLFCRSHAQSIRRALFRPLAAAQLGTRAS